MNVNTNWTGKFIYGATPGKGWAFEVHSVWNRSWTAFLFNTFQEQPTMWLNKNFTGAVVMHEFGHAIGFEHEHRRRELLERLDEKKVFHSVRFQLDISCVNCLRFHWISPIFFCNSGVNTPLEHNNYSRTKRKLTSQLLHFLNLKMSGNLKNYLINWITDELSTKSLIEISITSGGQAFILQLQFAKDC